MPPVNTQPPPEENLVGEGTRVGTPASVHATVTLTQLCSSSSRVTTITSPLEKVSSRALSPLQSATAFTRFCLPLACKGVGKGVTDPPKATPKVGAGMRHP